MPVYFIRHPQTTWNIEDRLQGNQEGTITELGKKNVQKFVNQLDLQHVDYIFHAENQRTKFLARHLLKQYPKAEVICISELNERNCGLYEGMSSAEVAKIGGGNINDYGKRYKWKPPQGESHEEVSDRVERLLQKLKEYSPDKVIICITSKGIIKLTLMIEKQISLEEMYKLQIKNLNMTQLW